MVKIIVLCHGVRKWWVLAKQVTYVHSYIKFMFTSLRILCDYIIRTLYKTDKLFALSIFLQLLGIAT